MPHLSTSQPNSPSVCPGLAELLSTMHAHLKKNVLLQDPFHGFKGLESLSESTGLSTQELSIIAVLRGMGGRFFQADQASIEQAVRNVFEGSTTDVRACMQELRYKGVIEIEPSRFKTMKVSLTERAEEAIVSNEPSFFSGEIPKGLTVLMNTFKEEFLHYQPVRRDHFLKTYRKIVSSNPELSVIQYLEDDQQPVSPIDKFVILATITSHVLYNRPFDLDYLPQFVRFESVYAMMLQMSITQSTWDPIEKGYIKLAGGGMVDHDYALELTTKGVDFFLAEMDPALLAQMKLRSMKKLNIIKPDDIESVSLVLTDNLQEHYNRLDWLLADDNMSQYVNLLDAGERMRGISALMYGAPGTGKTQMVYNLAKSSGRGLVELNIDMILSKWFGESQIKLRDFFVGYRSVVERSKRAPILFLNEADQIFMRRLSVSDSIDQTLNNLQNIVLTELEQFPEGGIMLATTNLVHNFDPATERRILMKMKFEKPTLEVRQKVWEAILPELITNDCQKLAEEYDFTPGEIRNISKKFKLEKLLSRGSMGDVEIIRKLANEERYSESDHKKAIGF